jgi:hypothetical protein
MGNTAADGALGAPVCSAPVYKIPKPLRTWSMVCQVRRGLDQHFFPQVNEAKCKPETITGALQRRYNGSGLTRVENTQSEVDSSAPTRGLRKAA